LPPSRLSNEDSFCYTDFAMIITRQGLDSLKLQFGSTTIAVNPVSKESSLKSVRFGADIVLESLNHPDFNGHEMMSHGDREPFVISGPGEYEIKDVVVRATASVSHYGKSKKINTIYSVILENMNVCFLGALDSTELNEEVKEVLDGIDVLVVPIGGGGVLDAQDANKLSVKLEPKIIIPSHYGEAGDKKALETFLKEEGNDKVSPIDKLTLKRKDLEGKEGEIVVLAS